jgi:hypothetical protein
MSYHLRKQLRRMILQKLLKIVIVIHKNVQMVFLIFRQHSTPLLV